MLCYAMLCYAMLCYAMLCYAKLCYAMLCYAMLCYAMLCYAMLCYAMLFFVFCSESSHITALSDYPICFLREKRRFSLIPISQKDLMKQKLRWKVWIECHNYHLRLYESYKIWQNSYFIYIYKALC